MAYTMSCADIAPVPFTLDEKPQTVRELLVGLTRLGIRQYNARRDEGQILKYLTREEIEAQAARGKVSSGLRGVRTRRRTRLWRTRCSALRTESTACLRGRRS